MDRDEDNLDLVESLSKIVLLLFLTCILKVPQPLPPGIERAATFQFLGKLPSYLS